MAAAARARCRPFRSRRLTARRAGRSPHHGRPHRRLAARPRHGQELAEEPDGLRLGGVVGVHNLMTMESSPADVRARRIIAKLAGVPASARGGRGQHDQSAAGDGRARGADVPRRRRRCCAATCRWRSPVSRTRAEGASWRRRRPAAATAIDAFVDRFEREQLPKAAGAYAVGPRDPRSALPRRGADRPAGAAAAGDRRARAGEKPSARSSTPRGGWINRMPRAGGVGADVLQDHPKRGALVPAAQKAVDALQAFVTSKGLVYAAVRPSRWSSPPPRRTTSDWRRCTRRRRSKPRR